MPFRPALQRLHDFGFLTYSSQPNSFEESSIDRDGEVWQKWQTAYVSFFVSRWHISKAALIDFRGRLSRSKDTDPVVVDWLVKPPHHTSTSVLEPCHTKYKRAKTLDEIKKKKFEEWSHELSPLTPWQHVHDYLPEQLKPKRCKAILNAKPLVFSVSPKFGKDVHVLKFVENATIGAGIPRQFAEETVSGVVEG